MILARALTRECFTKMRYRSAPPSPVVSCITVMDEGLDRSHNSVWGGDGPGLAEYQHAWPHQSLKSWRQTLRVAAHPGLCMSPSRFAVRHVKVLRARGLSRDGHLLRQKFATALAFDTTMRSCMCAYARVCVCVDARVHLHVYCVHACMYLCTSKQIHFVSMWMCMFFFCRSAVHYYKEKDTIRWWRGCAHVASKHIAVLAKTHSLLKREMSTHICIILFLHITLPPTFVNSRIICQIEITDLQIIWECWKAENTIYFLKTLFDTVSRITSQFNVYL